MNLPDYLQRLVTEDDNAYRDTEAEVLSMGEDALSLIASAVYAQTEITRSQALQMTLFNKIMMRFVMPIVAGCIFFGINRAFWDNPMFDFIWSLGFAVPIYLGAYSIFKRRQSRQLSLRYRNVVVQRVVQTVLKVQASIRLGLLLDIHANWADILSPSNFKALMDALVVALEQLDNLGYLQMTRMQKDEVDNMRRKYTVFTSMLPAEGPDEHQPGIPFSEFDEPVAIAILKMYGSVGAVERLSDVRYVASHSFSQSPKYGAARRVIAQAKVTLEKLETIAPDKQTLLRAADKPANPDYLLTPVLTEQETELLRPSDAPPKDKTL